MTLSKLEVDSLRNCFVTSSPNKVIKGAKSVERLLTKSLNDVALVGLAKCIIQMMAEQSSTVIMVILRMPHVYGPAEPLHCQKTATVGYNFKHVV